MTTPQVAFLIFILVVFVVAFIVVFYDEPRPDKPADPKCKVRARPYVNDKGEHVWSIEKFAGWVYMNAFDQVWLPRWIYGPEEYASKEDAIEAYTKRKERARLRDEHLKQEPEFLE